MPLPPLLLPKPLPFSVPKLPSRLSLISSDSSLAYKKAINSAIANASDAAAIHNDACFPALFHLANIPINPDIGMVALQTHDLKKDKDAYICNMVEKVLVARKGILAKNKNIDVDVCSDDSIVLTEDGILRVTTKIPLPVP